ncbi:hypothetical protein H4582DRAFT_2055911 [Lactarius indigo]|nr:hypothetical protein H4582DRAFT_2055911 [Lactarius indigo]
MTCGYPQHILDKAAELDDEHETMKSKFYSIGSLQPKAMISVQNDPDQTTQLTTSLLLLLSSTSGGPCYISMLGPHLTLTWIQDGEAPSPRYNSALMRLGQPINMQIEYTQFLRSGRGGGQVMPPMARGTRALSPSVALPQ